MHFNGYFSSIKKDDFVPEHQYFLTPHKSENCYDKFPLRINNVLSNNLIKPQNSIFSLGISKV